MKCTNKEAVFIMERGFKVCCCQEHIEECYKIQEQKKIKKISKSEE